MEAVSLGALEAMSCGKVMIGTKVGGFPQIINNYENGILVEPKNDDELANILKEICLNFEKYIKLGYEARKFVEKEYSWEQITRKTFQIYEKYINEVEK